MNKKSRVLSPGPLMRRVIKAAEIISEDKIPTYAAQAAFHIIVAAIPFLLLVVSLISNLAPTSIESFFQTMEKIIPDEFSDLVTMIFDEISRKSAVSTLSIYFIAALWSSSRGVAAVIRGVSAVYGTKENSSPIRDIIRSITYTLALIALIVITLIVLVFGNMIHGFVNLYIPPLEKIISFCFSSGFLLLFITMTIFFALIYYAVSRNAPLGFKKRNSRSPSAPVGFLRQLPGAVLVSVFWLIFSYCYNLYLRTFSNASYIYGSLAAVVLMMLWLYFCMTILLFGAEFNKFLHLRKQHFISE